MSLQVTSWISSWEIMSQNLETDVLNGSGQLKHAEQPATAMLFFVLSALILRMYYMVAVSVRSILTSFKHWNFIFRDYMDLLRELETSAVYLLRKYL